MLPPPLFHPPKLSVEGFGARIAPEQAHGGCGATPPPHSIAPSDRPPPFRRFSFLQLYSGPDSQGLYQERLWDTLNNCALEGLQPVVWHSQRFSKEDFHPMGVIPAHCWMEVTSESLEDIFWEARKQAQVWGPQGSGAGEAAGAMPVDARARASVTARRSALRRTGPAPGRWVQRDGAVCDPPPGLSSGLLSPPSPSDVLDRPYTVGGGGYYPPSPSNV